MNAKFEGKNKKKQNRFRSKTYSEVLYKSIIISLYSDDCSTLLDKHALVTPIRRILHSFIAQTGKTARILNESEACRVTFTFCAPVIITHHFWQ